MLGKLWPYSLSTPLLIHGTPFDQAVLGLKEFGNVKEYIDDHGEHTARVDSLMYSLALIEKKGVVGSVWYDDPSGRWTSFGRQRKLYLYLTRYQYDGHWEKRIRNDWMVHFWNDIENLTLVYGIHLDVIRVNRHFESLPR